MLTQIVKKYLIISYFSRIILRLFIGIIRRSQCEFFVIIIRPKEGSNWQK